MMTSTTWLVLDVPPPFDFRATATAHGWIALVPMAWEAERQAVRRIERLRSGEVVCLEIAGGGSAARPQLRVAVQHQAPLRQRERAEIRGAVARMFRLDEDFTEFYALCAARGDPWACLAAGGGRLLRSPTVFEDVVKTICTTNTRWRGTKRMVAQLVATLGKPWPIDPALRAFPTPEAIAQAPPEAFTRTVPLGYRGPYIRRVAQQVADGELDLEALRDASIPSATLKRQLLALRGIGPYAAHTLMMLLGRYEELAIDAEMRAFVRRKYFAGRAPKDAEMRAVYDGWGRWRYLAYWFDAVEQSSRTSGQLRRAPLTGGGWAAGFPLRGARRRAVGDAIGGALLSYIVATGFGAVAAHPHVAPAAAAVAGGVEEEPAAVGGGARFHARARLGREQLRRRQGDRPQRPLQRRTSRPPAPRAAIDGRHHVQRGEGLGQGGVQGRQIGALWQAPRRHAGEDARDRLPQGAGSRQHGDGGLRTALCRPAEIGRLRFAQHLVFLAPGDQLGVAGEPLPRPAGEAILQAVGEVQA
jgi:3-methyladenine DNA glycosylase/8-oxoguanine DNA glycosylase